MEYLGYALIVLYTLIHQAEGVLVRNYAKRHGDGGMLMNAVIALFAALFFLVTDRNGFYAPVEMLPLAAVNALLFGAGFYFTFLAFRCGPYGLTRLLSNLSLLFPIVYGIGFLGEQPSVPAYVGIAVLLISAVLVNLRGGKGDAQGSRQDAITLRWLIFVAVSTVANGLIAVLTRMQQIRFDNACSNEFQFLSIIGSFVLLALLGLILDRKQLRTVLKKGTLWGFGAGVCNGAKNLLTLVIYTLLPLSVISPMKTGLGMVLTFALALLVYREKYTRTQLLGVGLGIAAVILLAL